MTYDPKTKTWEWRQGYDYATEKYKAEIDLLRAQLRAGFDGSKEMQAEIDRLRAELERAQKRCEPCHSDFDRLRAENAELISRIDDIAKVTSPGSRNLDQMMRDMMIACNIVRAILAKTAKEGTKETTSPIPRQTHE